MANDKTNIVYFVLDGDNNPTEFAAIDTDSSEYMAPANLDPQTGNVRTLVADSSGDWNSGNTVSAGVAYSVMTTSGTVYDNSASWGTGTVSAGVVYSVMTTSGTVNSYSGAWTSVITNLSPVSANIATNTAAIAVLDDDVDVVGSVSANIGTNTTLIGGVINNLSPVSGNIGTTASADEYGAVHDSVASWSATDSYGGAGWFGAWYRVFSTSAAWNSTKSTVDAKEADWDYAGDTAASGVTHGYGALSGSMQLNGGGSLSAVAVSATGDSTLDYSVPSFDLGEAKVAWRRPALVRSGTAIVIPGGEDNLSFNLTSDGKSNLIASGISAKSIETGTLTSDSTSVALGVGNVTVSAYALEVGEPTACPIPNPFSYAQLTSNGTAEDSEQNVGIGADITSVNSNTSHIQWNDTDKDFELSAAGTYECTVRLVATVAATTEVTIKIKKNTDVKNSIVSKVHSGIDPTESSLAAVFNATTADTISVTTTDDGTQDVTALAGTTITVKRLK